MVSFWSLALLAAANLVVGQDIANLEPCGKTCYDNNNADFAKHGCASAADQLCLCNSPNYKVGIEDCAKQACSDPNYFGTVLAAVNVVCATAAAPVPTPPATSAPPAPSTPAPPTTTSAPPPATTSSSSSSSSSSSTSPTETAAKLTSSTPSPTSSATKTTSTGTSSSTTATPSSTTSAAAAAGPAEGSLSTATKIGIGVGAVAAAAGLIGVAICALLRRRQNKRNSAATKNWKISEPMPVSGRAYGHDYSNSYETGLSELEMKSRRYEDMLPRQVPRQMV